MAKILRHLAAAAATGALLGFACGLALLARNPVGGFARRAELLTATTVLYALLGLVPLALLLVAATRLGGRWRERAEADLEPGFSQLWALGAACLGLLVALRYLSVAFGRLAAGAGAGSVFSHLLPALLAIASGLAAAAVIRGLGRLLAGRRSRLGTALAGTALAAAVLLAAAAAIGAAPRGAGGAGEVATEVERREPSRRVALLGFDGLDPKLLEVLVGLGEMPHFQPLLEAGALSRLETLDSGLSPPIWTTVATGVDPGRHQVHDFFSRRLRGTGVDLAALKKFPRGFGAATLFDGLEASPLVEERFVTPATRRAPALWTVSSLGGVETCVVDWLGSWPSEAVRGVHVSDRAFVAWNLGEVAFERIETGEGKIPIRLQDRGSGGAASSELPGLCAPEPACRESFPPPAGAGAAHPGEDPARFHLEENRFYLAATEEILPSRRCDFLAFYSHLPDFINHHVDVPELEAALAGRYDGAQGRLLLETYREVDRTLGALLEHLGPETAVVVVSDHGVDVRSDLGRRWVSHAHGPDGVFLFRPSSRAAAAYRAPERLSVYDVAPAVLALLGLPLPSELARPAPAAVVAAELGDGYRRRTVPTAEVADAALTLEPTATDERMEEELKERLRSLGYIE